MKYFFYDVETTGTRYWKNGIHQISGTIEINGHIKENFDFKVKPYDAALIEDEALAVSNVTREEVLAYAPMRSTYNTMIEMLGNYVDKFDKTDKFYKVGYNNAAFDDHFFRAWFVQNGDKYFGSWFRSDALDVRVLAANYLKEERNKMKDFKLSTVAEYLGIEVDESMLHDASYDIILTREVFKIVSKTPKRKSFR